MKIVMSTLKGEVKSTSPRTRVRLVRLEPIMSPNASCTRPRLTAAKSSVSSGNEVPMATIFAPMRMGGTPKATAIFEAE